MDIGVGVQIELKQPDDFLKIKETLTRIGVASNQQNTLYQSCNILHKRGLYYIVHFKEMFKLDGKPCSLDATDVGRRNTICDLLEQWGLCTIINPEAIKEPRAPMSMVKIIPFKDKGQWSLQAKYQVGKRL